MNLQHVHCLQESMVRILPFSLNDNITFRNARSDLYYWILFIAKPRFIQARKQEKKSKKKGLRKNLTLKPQRSFDNEMIYLQVPFFKTTF